ncbi:hypothetical protein [Kibdelosporangium aridum]|uniref:hypothetical protein n=1 Tax=Kibdelosporangium aridum TaxID=2030 RepID=UPI0035E7148D
MWVAAGVPSAWKLCSSPAGALGVADPDEAEGGRVVLADAGGESGFTRRLDIQVAPRFECGNGPVQGKCVLGDQCPGADRVQAELELGDYAEVSAATAQAPEQLGAFGLARPDDFPVGGDHRVRRHVVAGQAVLAGKPSHAAAEGEAADAGV